MLEHNISNTTSDILTLNRKKIRPGVYLVLFEIIRSKFDEKRFYVAVINRKNDSVVEASIDSSFGLLMRHGVNPEKCGIGSPANDQRNGRWPFLHVLGHHQAVKPRCFLVVVISS